MLGAMGESGMRCLGMLWTSPARSGSTGRLCPSSPFAVTFLCNGIANLLSGNSPSGEDEQDEDDVDDDVHQPAVRVHPVAHLRHGPLGAPAKQQVREHRERRYEYGCGDERQGAK